MQPTVSIFLPTYNQAAFIVELARYYATLQKPPEVDATIAKLTANPADFPDGRLTAGEFYLSLGKQDLAIVGSAGDVRHGVLPVRNW